MQHSMGLRCRRLLPVFFIASLSVFPYRMAAGQEDVLEESSRLSDAGKHEESVALLRSAVAIRLDSQELNRRFLIETTLLCEDKQSLDPAILDEAASAGIRANEHSFIALEVDANAFTATLGLLSKTRRIQDIDELFQQAIAIEANPVYWLDYAHALDALMDPRTESAYRSAYELAITRPGEEGDSIHEYGRWLLRQNRPKDVLALLPPESYADYTLDLLRAVVLEKLGRAQEADAYYGVYHKKSSGGSYSFDEVFPLAKELRIPDSALQEKYKLHFAGSPASDKLPEDIYIMRGLAFMLFGEANTENIGGKRAVVWTAKNRTLRGLATRVSNGTLCPAVPAPVDRPNNFMLPKYQQVLCQKRNNNWEFLGLKANCPKWCENPMAALLCRTSPENERVVNDVFHGVAPDPVSQRCANGLVLSTPDCEGKIACETRPSDSPVGSYFIAGPHSFNSNGATQCGTNRGKVCKNGKTDHTFFSNPKWPSKLSGWPTENLYAGTKISDELDFDSLPVQTDGKAYFYVNKKMRLRAHLEHEYSLDTIYLYLETAPAPDGPWDSVAASRNGAYGDLIFDSLDTAANPRYYRWDLVGGPAGMKYTLYLNYTIFP